MSPGARRKYPVKNPARLSAAASGLFPPGVIVADLEEDGDAALLHPEERQQLGRAVPKRVREFSAGRTCARRALAEFGVRDAALPTGADRRPVWPPQLLGSITHTDGWCAAAVASRARFRAIGLDAETIGRVGEDVWPQICLPAEITWLRRLSAREQAEVAALIFSAKEAFYKCQFELTGGQWLDFNDVHLDLIGWEFGEGRFVVRPRVELALTEPVLRPFAGRFRLTAGRAITGIAIETPAETPAPEAGD